VRTFRSACDQKLKKNNRSTPARSMRRNGERALTGTDDAGGVFCHADVRVGGLADATHSAAAPVRYTIVNNAVAAGLISGRRQRSTQSPRSTPRSAL